MKFWVLALMVLGSACFAQYSEPPISGVMAYNENYSSSLNGTYNATNASSGNITFFFGGYNQTQYVNASLDIAGMTLLIDNVTAPVEGLALLIARGYSMGHLTSKPAQGYPNFVCDDAWHQHISDETAWRCDFDGDFCSEYENSTYVVYDLNATFTFRGLNSTARANATLVPVPEEILQEMKSSSGLENLTINLTGNVTFMYAINNQTGESTCPDNVTTVNASIPVSINRSYRVAGEGKLFFLLSPALREQWFRNNDFNMLVLSQAPLYRAELDMNGKRALNITLRNFSVVQNAFGVQEIRSNLTNETGYSESDSNVTTPIPLEHGNDSFLYAYGINYSYSGLGLNNFSLRVTDSFMNESGFNESVTSRALSHDGQFTEDGLPAGNFTRPSSAFEKETLTQVTIGFGLIALVLFLAFFNFWLS
ncbi:MAG TPA: hypothetical protein VLD37_07490 [Candidatus Bilamarchaeum sp.]|nr:hypothetical protein [Candidatus Bilamarchaeum sp.]